MKFFLNCIIGFTLLVGHCVQAQYTTRPIANYSYSLFSAGDTASIDLYDSRAKQVGIAIFLPVSVDDLPPPTLSTSDGLIRLYYRIERLHDMVDLLRNESPLAIRYWNGPQNNSHIGTYQIEPAGEAE